jgi:Na+/melibiose symporter-like transporter
VGLFSYLTVGQAMAYDLTFTTSERSRLFTIGAVANILGVSLGIGLGSLNNFPLLAKIVPTLLVGFNVLMILVVPSEPGSTSPARVPLVAGWRMCLSNYNFSLLLCISSICSILNSLPTMAKFLFEYAYDHQDAKSVNSLFSLLAVFYAVSNLVGSALQPVLLQKLGKFGSVYAFMLLGIAYGLVAFPLTYARRPIVYLASMPLLGLCVGLLQPLLNVLFGDTIDYDRLIQVGLLASPFAMGCGRAYPLDGNTYLSSECVRRRGYSRRPITSRLSWGFLCSGETAREYLQLGDQHAQHLPLLCDLGHPARHHGRMRLHTE